ncbi:ROK family protein [Curtobacterium pusillum]|uniref:ROK family protein n=1 Tax=Curtobacterium pusillum TaxID=69373 RepID=A0ABX2MAT3_9MICO|nr:ROK family protein [Curtobacterium pusillum]NUU15147.1 ROK family protein [Curtobacterium pusillum]GLK31525.1 transcriptional regulator [Curtobacterium pusillum]
MITLGVDIGGTKTAAGLVAEDGRVLARAEVPTPAQRGPDAVLETAERLCAELIAAAPAPVLRCGVGSAGVIDPVTGTVVSATSSMRDWAGTDVRGRLGGALRLPVVVLNDVHAHAVAEARFGAGAGTTSMLLLALGTGIGGALVRDGVVEVGRHGAAGHFGHVPTVRAIDVPCTCGRAGHLEAIASGPAIAGRYRRAAGRTDVVDTRDVFRRAAEGDAFAANCTSIAAKAIGEAIGGFVNAHDPDVVVVAGGLATADPAWFDEIVRAAGGTMIPIVEDCPIVAARLGADSGIVGAATWADRRSDQEAGVA